MSARKRVLLLAEQSVNQRQQTAARAGSLLFTAASRGPQQLRLLTETDCRYM